MTRIEAEKEKPIGLCDKRAYQLLKNKDFLILVSAGGLQAGVNSGWGGILPQILKNANFDTNYIGWNGFLTSIIAAVGGWVVSLMADKFFPRAKKVIVVLMFFGTSAGFLWFSLSMPTPFFSTPILSNSIYSITSALFIASWFQGATDPFFFELCAEVTYPLPESISGGIIVLIYNIGSLMVLGIVPFVNVDWMNSAQTVTFIICGLTVLLAVKIEYKRSEEELKKNE